MRRMVDILVRNVEARVARRLKQKAKVAGKSVNETAREALAAFVTPDRSELIGRVWAALQRSRVCRADERIGTHRAVRGVLEGLPPLLRGQIPRSATTRLVAPMLRLDINFDQ